MLAHDQLPIEAKAKALSETLTEHKTSQEFVRTSCVLGISGIRRTVLFLMLVVGLAYQSAHRARADQNESTVKIMTQNIDAETDFGYLTAVSNVEEFLNGAYLTYLEINASNIPYRAALLASEITLNHPALVGLQEVTLWRTGPLNSSTTPLSATTVLYDQLNLLLIDLANEYVAVAVQTLTDVEVPVPQAELKLALRCSLWIALLGGSSVHSAPQSLLKIESDINGILPAGGGPLPFISFRS